MTLAEKNFIKKTPAKGFRRHFSLKDRLNKTQVGDTMTPNVGQFARNAQT